MVLSDGIPKICVPLTETSESRLLIEAENILSHPADLAEWRIDFYEDADNPEKVIAILQKLRSVLKDMPILATYRTASEGGNREISEEAYKALLKGICAEKAADIIDVEIKRNQNTVKQIIETAQQHGIYVIGSFHNFQCTPSDEEIRTLFKEMHDLKCDILKLAVMPKNNADVLRLLEITDEASKLYAEPLITMSMSEIGSISRILGEKFGSCITFGSLSQASAPGQINVEKLYQLLQEMHHI